MPDTEAPEAAAPVLLHAGTYALYRTAAGGLHVAFRRTMALDPEDDQVKAVTGAPDEHLPDLPPVAVSMLERLQAGERPSPMAMMKALMARGGNGDDALPVE